MNKYKPSNKENDHRLKNSKESNNILDKLISKQEAGLEETFESKLTKMKIIGKIGDEPTELDRESANEEIDLKLKNLRCQTNSGFASIRTNNCVFKGKWCYEVLLLSNNLMQIGWCQLNTPFKHRDGVGDDPTSYAYDGHRVVKWHAGKEKYGISWDIGDVIGVCINLEDRVIEYYHNGDNLGIAFENIPFGENIAYFPAASFSKSGNVVYNFGGTNMAYNYTGYLPMDIPRSVYQNTFEITADLLEVINTHTLKVLARKEISKIQKLMFSSHIFNFLVEISFKDLHIFIELLIPFMLKLVVTDELTLFLEHILPCVNSKNDFILDLFENIINVYESCSVRGLIDCQIWLGLINLFKRILSIDIFAQGWIDSKKFSQHLKMIFNGNFVKMNRIVSCISERKQSLEEKGDKLTKIENIKKFYKDTLGELEITFVEEGALEYDSKINHVLRELILYFINDGRTFRLNQRNVTLRSLLLDNFTKNIKDSSYFGNDIFNYFNRRSNEVPNEPYIKYFYFNLIEIFFKECSTQFLTEISFEPFMSRSRADSLYFDEVGIGGTIAHVNLEYGSKIKAEFKEKKDSSLANVLFHKILQLTSSYISPLMRDYQKNLRMSEDFINLFNRDSTRSTVVKSLYRCYLNVFTKRNQMLFYKFSYFVVNLINTLSKENKEIIYYIPKSVMQIPYEIFRLLVHIKTPFIKSSEARIVNVDFPFSKEDNYVYQILYFYCQLFNDSNIANPELRENFMGKISFFLKKKFLMKEFDQNQILLEMLIKGLMKNMTNDIMSHYASQNMVKLIKPSCFGEKNATEARINLILVVKKFFEDNLDVFHEFMDNYNKLLNKIMTDYTVSLTEASSKILSNSSGSDIYHNAVSNFKKCMFNYSIFCELMKILEFLLSAYPNEFFDIQTINFSRISNFLKNLSSRVLDKSYIEKLIQSVEKIKPGKSAAVFTQMANSVIGIFLNLDKNKNFSNFSEFVNKLVSQADFDVEPFLNVLTYVKSEENTKAGIEAYRSIIYGISSLKVNKVEKVMSEKEWEDKMQNMFICIICYVNEMNKVLVPCGHGKKYS